MVTPLLKKVVSRLVADGIELMIGTRGDSKGKGKARKDLATVHTRKLILETIPTAPIWECYPAIKEVIIKAVCHVEPDDDDLYEDNRFPDDEYVPPPIYDTLAAYSRKHAGPEPLHVDIQDSRSIAFSRLKLIANREKEKAKAGESHDRITYGFHGMQHDSYTRMIGPYMLRGVVSFLDFEVQKPGSYVEYFVEIMRACFKKAGLEWVDCTCVEYRSLYFSQPR